MIENLWGFNYVVFLIIILIYRRSSFITTIFKGSYECVCLGESERFDEATMDCICTGHRNKDGTCVDCSKLDPIDRAIMCGS